MNLSKELFDEYFAYIDGRLYWKKDIGRVCSGQVAGSIGSKGYLQVGFFNKRVLVHRIIFMIHNGFLPEIVDHIDGNKLNNSIDNLRAANENQNKHNSVLSSNNTSGVKGVHWHKRCNKWIAKIKINGVSKHIGCFSDLQEAKQSVEKARIALHGEFARHM